MSRLPRILPLLAIAAGGVLALRAVTIPLVVHRRQHQALTVDGAESRAVGTDVEVRNVLALGQAGYGAQQPGLKCTHAEFQVIGALHGFIGLHLAGQHLAGVVDEQQLGVGLADVEDQGVGHREAQSR